MWFISHSTDWLVIKFLILSSLQFIIALWALSLFFYKNTFWYNILSKSIKSLPLYTKQIAYLRIKIFQSNMHHSARLEFRVKQNIDKRWHIEVLRRQFNLWSSEDAVIWVVRKQSGTYGILLWGKYWRSNPMQ